MTQDTDRNNRKELIGFVRSKLRQVSQSCLRIQNPPPPLQKGTGRKTTVHVHDEKDDSNVGDKVRIMQQDRLSKLKRWRITEFWKSTNTLIYHDTIISRLEVADNAGAKKVRMIGDYWTKQKNGFRW